MPDNTNVTPSVDLAAINAEIAKLSPSEIAEQLTKVRVRQKVQQKKQYQKGGMKAYQAKQREKFKLMKEQALATPATHVNPQTGKPYENLWEQINAASEELAEAKLNEIAAVPEEDETPDETPEAAA